MIKDEDIAPSSTPTVPDGFYWAVVQTDGHGAFRTAVRVFRGVPYDSDNDELLPSSCRGFENMLPHHAKEVWPTQARINHERLVDRLRTLTEIGDDMACLLPKRLGKKLVQRWNEAKGTR